MAVRLESVAFDVPDPVALGTFWGSLLGREPHEQTDGVLLPGSDAQVGLRFVAATAATSGLNRLQFVMAPH